MMAEIDAKFMRQAIDRGRSGDPSPNPHVGAVVVVAGEVVGQGHHEEAGGPHAEVQALLEAGEKALGATLYITLEPCNHEGRTPPCTEAIINAGVKRVVIGCRDPNPNFTDGGIERLQAAGVEVTTGVEEEAALRLIAPWSKYINTGSAYLSVKLGLSVDGRTASRTGRSKWITCEDARVRVHQLRASHDAVMVGVNTVIADDPLLTVRDVPGQSPIRVIVDSKLRTPLTSHVVASATELPTCILTTEDASDAIAQTLGEHGVNVIRLPSTTQGRCDMAAALKELAAREVVSVLCEGGAELAGSLFAARLPSEAHLFVAPLMLGPRGRPAAVDWAGPDGPDDAPRISPSTWELCGTDAYLHGPVVYPKKKQGGGEAD